MHDVIQKTGHVTLIVVVLVWLYFFIRGKKDKGNLLLGTSWVRLFTGLPGGGKTYFAVLQICDVLSCGGNVYTNVKINMEGMQALCRRRRGVEVPIVDGVLQGYHFLSDDECRVFHRSTPAGVDGVRNLVVIDEAHLYFPVKTLEIKGQENVGAGDVALFLTRCRHDLTEVILITQSESNISAPVRRLATKWTFRDGATLSFLGLKPFHQLVAIEEFPGGASRSIVQNRDKHVFAAYQSRQFAGTMSRAESVDSPQRPEAKKGATPVPWSKLVLVGGAALLFWKCSSNPETAVKKESKEKHAPSLQADSAPPRVSPPGSAGAAPVYLPAPPELPPFTRVVPVYASSITNSCGLSPRLDGWRAILASPPATTPETIRVGEYSVNLDALVYRVDGLKIELLTAKGIENGLLGLTQFRGLNQRQLVDSAPTVPVGPVLPDAGPDNSQLPDLKAGQ